jgi:hypothetical protein
MKHALLTVTDPKGTVLHGPTAVAWPLYATEEVRLHQLATQCPEARVTVAHEDGTVEYAEPVGRSWASAWVEAVSSAVARVCHPTAEERLTALLDDIQRVRDECTGRHGEIAAMLDGLLTEYRP